METRLLPATLLRDDEVLRPAPGAFAWLCGGDHFDAWRSNFREHCGDQRSQGTRVATSHDTGSECLVSMSNYNDPWPETKCALPRGSRALSEPTVLEARAITPQ